jgi:hypothetical protein
LALQRFDYHDFGEREQVISMFLWAMSSLLCRAVGSCGGVSLKQCPGCGLEQSMTIHLMAGDEIRCGRCRYAAKVSRRGQLVRVVAS